MQAEDEPPSEEDSANDKTGSGERRSEIGLRRALGATRGHIRTQFLAEAIALSPARRRGRRHRRRRRHRPVRPRQELAHGDPRRSLGRRFSRRAAHRRTRRAAPCHPRRPPVPNASPLEPVTVHHGPEAQLPRVEVGRPGKGRHRGGHPGCMTSFTKLRESGEDRSSGLRICGALTRPTPKARANCGRITCLKCAAGARFGRAGSDRQPGGGEDDKRARHCGNGPADHHAGGDPEGECERGVGDGDDAALV